MISFRYHMVSITAVFLALALGIAMGATVVDRATVDFLEERLSSVERRANEAFARSNELEAERDALTRFNDQMGDEAVRGRLAGTPVLVVAVRGVPTDALQRLRRSLTRAQAISQGTLWLSARLRLDEQDDIDRMRAVLGGEPGRGDHLRRVAFERLATTWTAPTREGTPLPALVEAGFIEIEQPEGATVDPAALPAPGTRVVVASAADVQAPNAAVAVPLVARLAVAGVRIVGVDFSPPPESGVRAVPFASALRGDVDIARRVSTVDNPTEHQGRIATVLALVAAGSDLYGHYGTAPRAERMVPEPPP